MNDLTFKIKSIKNFRVSFNRVLIEVEKLEEKSSGGVFFTEETIKNKLNRGSGGIFIKCGEFAFLDATHIPNPGDRVVLNDYAGTVYETDDGKHYRICQDKDIVGYAYDLSSEEEELKAKLSNGEKQ